MYCTTPLIVSSKSLSMLANAVWYSESAQVIAGYVIGLACNTNMLSATPLTNECADVF